MEVKIIKRTEKVFEVSEKCLTEIHGKLILVRVSTRVLVIPTDEVISGLSEMHRSRCIRRFYKLARTEKDIKCILLPC